MQKNILQYLEATVRRCPDKIAFSDGETAMTFVKLYSSARAVGTALCRMGLRSRPIAVYMKKSPATLAAFLGAVYAGCYYVPLDDEMPRHRIELILQKLNAGALICDADTENAAHQLPFDGAIRRFDDMVQCTAPDDERLEQIRRAQLDTDPIYVVFTSGSTGVPKGVVGCHRAVIDYIEGLCEVLSFDETTVFGNQTLLYFDACLKEIIPTLKYGATTYLIPKPLFMFPVKLVEYINVHGINTLCWVVSALTMISSMRTFDKVRPAGLRLVAFASEVFPARQLRIWCDTLPDTRFVNLYGPTESTGICCYYEVPRDFDENDPLPIGQPLPNTEILLLDGNNRVPPVGEQGEICVRGTRLTPGYYADSEQTAKAFVQNPLNSLYPELIYRTGDIGKLDARGRLIFCGRRDYQIKHMGHRIELGEIEAAANANDAVESCCCVFDGEKQRIVLLYVGDISSGALTEYMKGKLPRYMLPNTVRQLDIMPHTPNGKIDRKLLSTQYCTR